MVYSNEVSDVLDVSFCPDVANGFSVVSMNSGWVFYMSNFRRTVH